MLVKTRLFMFGALAVALAGAAHVDRSAGQSAATPQIGPWGFDVSGVDAKAKPGDSFFDYANGAWDARTVIPADKTRFGAFDALRDRTEDQVRRSSKMRRNPARHPPPTRARSARSTTRSWMRLGSSSSMPHRSRMISPKSASTKTKADIAALMGARDGAASATASSPWGERGRQGPDHYAVYLGQAGLGLPDRDYYLKRASRRKKAKYEAYVARC